MDKLYFVDKVSPSINVEKQRFRNFPRQKKTVYLGNELISFRIAGNMANTFLDPKFGLNLKGKLNLLSISAGANSSFNLVLDKAGVASGIKNITVKMGGVSVQYDEYAVLQCIMKDLESNTLYCANQGLLLEGLKQQAQGQTLAFTRDGAGAQTLPERATLDFCLPLHTLLETDQPIPLFGSAPIEIDILLQDSSRLGAYQFVETNANNPNIDNTVCNYTELELLGNYIIFSDQVMAEINRLHGGVYELHSTNWYHAGDTIPSGQTTFSSNVPISVSSMKRILVSHRDSGKILPTSRALTEGASTESLSLGHRVNQLKQWNFEIDSVSYPTNTVRNVNGTTMVGGPMFYELLNADDKFGSLGSSGSFCCGSGASDQIQVSRTPFTLTQTSSGVPYGAGFNVGSYITGYNFEVVNQHKARDMRDGISTTGSNMNYQGQFTTALTRDAVIDFYVQCDVKLVLDTNGSNVITYIS